MNCWEFRNCPPQTYGYCPAYPDRGRECWKLDRTICAAGALDAETLADKAAFCRDCEFYLEHIAAPPEKCPVPDSEAEAVEDALEG